MNAIDFSRMILANANCDPYYSTYNQYPSIELEVPSPTICPCCGKTMPNELYPIMAINNASLNQFKTDNVQKCTVVSIYRCASCDNLFAIWSEHDREENDDGYDDDKFNCEIKGIYPNSANITSFSTEINNLSSDFVKIYNQSEMAEVQGLCEVCGMGYRKSLEFLIDAYIRKNNPEENINADLNLSTKIENYINDDRAKVLAKKSAWLGNDATHIVKKHPNRDIQDMKKFIKALIQVIETEFAFEDANSI